MTKWKLFGKLCRQPLFSKRHVTSQKSEEVGILSEATVSRNEMETIITQDPGMCLLVYRHPVTDRRRPERPSLCTDTAQAVMLWLQTQIATVTEGCL